MCMCAAAVAESKVSFGEGTLTWCDCWGLPTKVPLLMWCCWCCCQYEWLTVGPWYPVASPTIQQNWYFFRME
jgi:hypothetical protein